MAITAMGLGTKGAPANTNLDPQRQFWSWLNAFIHPDEYAVDSHHHDRAYFGGFACTQTSPAGMSIQIGGGSAADSALLVLTNGRAVLLSTDGTPQTVAIPTAPASGSRIDAVVSYIDTTSPDPESEAPGTPEYVHTIVVSGTAASSPSAPTDAQIVSALPAGSNSKYYRWCDVRVAQGATTITNSNITDRKPDAPELYWTAQDIEDTVAKITTDSVDLGGFILTIQKCGRIVMVSTNQNTTGIPDQSDTTTASLASKYRPLVASSAILRYGASPTPGGVVSNSGFITINTNGTLTWGLGVAPNQISRATFSITYISAS